jgi:hypothetical protein
MKGKTVQERYRGKNEEEAERCFQQARRVARQQKAKSLELRMAVSLGQSWAAQGKEKEAHLLLNYLTKGIVGSLRGLTPKTCKRPRQCWRS